LRSAGGLLRRGSGQLKVGLLVLGLAREQRCNAPVRTGSRVAQLDLLDDDRAHVVLELHAPGLGVGGAGGSAMQVLELALRQVNRPWMFCSIYSIYSIGGCYTCYIVYYTIVLHSVLDANFGFEQIVFSIWARPGRGLAASSSTSNRVNSKWFKYQKKVELCYIVM